MATAFQSDAFQNDAFQITASGAVWPDPSEVLFGVYYGPTGADYMGTYVCPAGGNKIIYIFDD